MLSVLISVVLNGSLFVAMMFFIKFENELDTHLQHTMVIDPIQQEIIDEILPDIVEEHRDMPEMPDLPVFNDFTVEIDVQFDAEPEALDFPVDQNLNQLAALLSDIASPVVLTGLMPGRTAVGRANALRSHGGSEETEAAVRRALDWLKANQEKDGSWRGSGWAESRTGMTGLALLTFLAHGETTSSAEYGASVAAGLRFLVEKDQKDDGTFRAVEKIVQPRGRGGVYAHAIATYALSEAYSMTRNPLLLEPMEKGIQRIIRGQREDGGFDYAYALQPGPEGGGRERATSVAAWQIQAMKAAHLAQVDIPGLQSAMALAASGIKLNQRQDGKFIYASASPRIVSIDNRYIMTAIGAFSLQILGEGRSPPVRDAMRQIAALSPEAFHQEGEPVYAWYYATQAYFHEGGAVWARWNRLFAPMAVNNQNPDGSWNWQLGRTGNYGPVYHTTLTALSLMVYYRNLPTTQTELFQVPSADSAEGLGEDDVIFNL